MATGYFWDSIAYPAETYDTVYEELHVGLGADAQCVLRGVANELNATGATSPVVVGTGAAFAKGKYRRWTGTTNIVVATPSAATRIDRIVVAVDFAAKTVELTSVAGAEGGGVPALTQTDGTLWEVPLWQASITTGGTITLTDERTRLHPPMEVITAMLQAGVLSADASGRALMATGLFNAATVAAKFGADAFTNAVLLQLVQDGAFAADANTRALFANLFMPNAKLARDAQYAPGDVKFNRLASLGGSDGRRMVVGGNAYESWVHCDGGAAVNGYTIPDYRDKVIAGASGSHAANTTGGADTTSLAHTHGVGTIAGASTAAGNHNHSIASDAITHYHLLLGGGGPVAAGGPAYQPVTDYNVGGAHAHGGLTGSTNPTPHSHTITGTSASGGSATQDVRQATAYEYAFMYVG